MRDVAFALALFRRHVGGGADGAVGGGQGGDVEVLGDAEVGELERAVGEDHEVGRLEVAVDDAGLVGVLQAVAELAAEIDDVLPAHAAAAGHDVVERFALDVLHGVVARALELAAGVEPDDVGVVELLEDVGLALEARDGAGVVVAESGGHDLDGDDQDGLVGLDVAGAVDGPHGAGAQLLVDVERPELLSDQHKHPRPRRSVVVERCLW